MIGLRFRITLALGAALAFSARAGELRPCDASVFEVDFDSQKDVLRIFGVRQQSTLIGFRGTTERARAVGITDPAAIAALFVATD